MNSGAIDTLTTFEQTGYEYSPNDSDAFNPVFLRKQ